ncbi:MAG: hypothetical protein ACD_22C00166G0012 [uncultured bacterium]|nr:MAG: hypothetical protein ACD_22C00166G0012 [uncultured bacterium]
MKKDKYTIFSIKGLISCILTSLFVAICFSLLKLKINESIILNFIYFFFIFAITEKITFPLIGKIQSKINI